MIPQRRRNSDPYIPGTAPVFAGSSIPIAYLEEYLKRGATLEQFLEDYPTVSRAEATTVKIAAFPDAQSRGLSEENITELRKAFSNFAEDWDADDMDVYDKKHHTQLN